MKQLKYIVLALVILLNFPLHGGERKKPKSMKELTDPNSFSYVPIPYPKNKKEVIADLEYYVKEFCRPENEVNLSGKPGYTGVVLRELFSSNSRYKIGAILKIKNRNEDYSGDYSWLIHVMNKAGNVVLRAVIYDTGLMGLRGGIPDKQVESASPRSKRKFERLRTLFTEDHVIRVLSQCLGRTVTPKEIKKFERIVYRYSYITRGHYPIMEITMKSGKLYYYSQLKDKLYSVEKKIPWKKKAQGFRESTLNLVTHVNYLPDSLNDQLVVLKEIPRKKEQ